MAKIIGLGADTDKCVFVFVFRVISNLGDYAWGPGGLDAIVTELMNQMEGTGPPPLSKDRIDNLPDVKISAEQVGELRYVCGLIDLLKTNHWLLLLNYFLLFRTKTSVFRLLGRF